MQTLYVLYDSRCGLCSRARRWLVSQPAFLTLVFIPSASEAGARLFPGLRASPSPEEVIVISDEGGVYRGSNAWIMCLFALEEYRELALRLSRPWLRPLARGAVELISENRSALSRAFGLVSDEQLLDVFRSSPASCSREPASKR